MKPPIWQAESLRLTSFLAPDIQIKDEGWWAKLTSANPESRTAKPARGELVETGVFQGNELTLSVQPGRIDWILRPRLSPDDEAGEIKSVGRFDVAGKTFSATMSNWLSVSPPIVRLAYGAVLLEPVQDRKTGYVRIAEFVPGVNIDPASEDFFYQINRPRESATIKGIRLNRLSKWSVASFQLLGVSLGIPLNQPIQPLVYPHSGKPTFACRVELDLSTAADIREKLPGDKLSGVFDELVSLGAEISQRGDVP